MTRLEHGHLARLGLLDLHDHVGLGKDARGVGQDLGTSRDIIRILEVDAEAGAGLDEQLVSGRGQLRPPRAESGRRGTRGS